MTTRANTCGSAIMLKWSGLTCNLSHVRFLVYFLTTFQLQHERLSEGTCLLRNRTLHQRKHTTIIFECGCILIGQRFLYTKAHSAWRLFSATVELLLIFTTRRCVSALWLCVRLCVHHLKSEYYQSSWTWDHPNNAAR